VAAFAQSTAFGSPVLPAQGAAEQTETLGGAAAIAIAAVVVAVFRPRLGREAAR